MNTSEFHQLADQQMIDIEDAIDQSGADIDFEIQGGVLTLTFEDDSQIIINKQEPLHQIWVATKQGGFHFAREQQEWRCNRSGRELLSLLSEAILQQGGEEVSF